MSRFFPLFVELPEIILKQYSLDNHELDENLFSQDSEIDRKDLRCLWVCKGNEQQFIGGAFTLPNVRIFTVNLRKQDLSKAKN